MDIFHRLISRFAILCFTVSSLGCTNINYLHPINSMASAATQSHETVLTISEVGSKSFRDMYVTAPNRLLELEGCGAISDTCEIYSLARDGTRQKLESEAAFQNALAISSGIVDYSIGLQSIVSADTAGEVQIAVTATLGNLERISSTALAGKTLSDFTPATNALNWVIGQYVNKLKADGLARSISAADPAIQDAVAVLNNFAEVASTSSSIKMANVISAKQSAYNDGRGNPGNENNAISLFDAVNSYSKFLEANTDGSFSKLGTAHSALLKSIEGDDRSFVEYVNALNGFLIQAKNVQDMAKAIADVELVESN